MRGGQTGGSDARTAPKPGKWHLLLAFSPVVLALLALGGLLLFHCARI